MERKEYLKPDIDIVEFDSQNDIITASKDPRCGGVYHYDNEEGDSLTGYYPSHMTV